MVLEKVEVYVQDKQTKPIFIILRKDKKEIEVIQRSEFETWDAKTARRKQMPRTGLSK